MILTIHEDENGDDDGDGDDDAVMMLPLSVVLILILILILFFRTTLPVKMMLATSVIKTYSGRCTSL